MIHLIRKMLVQRALGRSGQFAEVNGARLYYEVYGKGEPLLMFHGGLSTLETFRCQIPELSKDYQVILPERSGHGHSPDVPGDFSYKKMAAEMAGFMKKLGLSASKMIGYSDGANLMLYLMMDYPELVECGILIGGNFHFNGCEPEFVKEIENLPMPGTGDFPIDEKYAKYSPDGPEHFKIVFQKIKKLWLNEPVFRASDLNKIKAPVLVIAGDRDVVRPEHTVELFRGIPTAQLLTVPGTTHRVIKEKPEVVNRAILNFLKNPVYINQSEKNADVTG